MDDRSGDRKLSPRETRILELAIEGHTDKSISQALAISESTVATYWGRIRIKYGPLSRTQIVATFLREVSQSDLADLREKNNHLVEELHSRSHDGAEPDADYYHEIMDGAADAILVVREDGSIEAVNREAERLFGWNRSELEGSRLDMLIPESFRENHIEQRKHYLESPEKRLMGEHLDTPAVDKSGNEFTIRATLSVIEGRFGKRVVCIVRPA